MGHHTTHILPSRGLTNYIKNDISRMSKWSIEPLNDAVREELLGLPADHQARFLRICELLIEHGPQNVGKPYVLPIRDKLWEMRLKGRDGISRALYMAAKGRRLIVLRAFVKKTQKTPDREIKLALKRSKEIK